MLSPKLLQMLGIRDGDKIAQEMSQVMQQKQQMEQGQGSGGGLSGSEGLPQPQNAVQNPAMANRSPMR